MDRVKLFKKWYKNKNHDYEMEETLSSTDEYIDIAWIMSGRGRGKSFEISSQLIADAWYDDKQFGYIRRNDATIYDVEQYFEDKTDFIKDMTDNTCEGITRSKGKLFFYHNELDRNGNVKKVLDKECGYFFALSRQASYKSLQYPEVYNLIYEEVLTDGSYLNSEPEKLMNLYSTVKRNKDNFRMWLVNNLVTAVNPYSASWGIQASRMKPNEIKLIKLFLGTYDEDKNEKYLLVAAHYLQSKDELSKEDLKKNVKNRIKTGIANNKWDELKLYSNLPLSIMKKYQIIDTVIFEYDDMMFQGNIVEIPENLVEYFVNNTENEPIELSEEKIPILYIRRKTTKPFKYTRLYTNNSERLSEYSTRGFCLIYQIDKIIDEIIKRGWVIGADNLTMNDFSRVFSKLRLMKIDY